MLAEIDAEPSIAKTQKRYFLGTSNIRSSVACEMGKVSRRQDIEQPLAEY
jgi:hypothetical protein